MKKVFNFSIPIFLFSIIIFSFNACVDQDFDEPPRDGGITDYETNSTVEAVKKIYEDFNANVPPDEVAIAFITEDVVIGGIVTADDASGNFYKELVMEDATGGIKISLEFTDFNNDYPIGRQIWVKCRGLVIDKYQDSYEIGGGIDEDGRLEGIQRGLADDFIIRGLRGEYIIPEVSSMGNLSLGDVNRLVTLENVEFIDGETDVVFSDNVGLTSVNRNLKDCNGNTILLRTSGYADFAGSTTPAGNGNITAVVGAFNDDLQLFIRDLNDVAAMTGARCSGGGGNPPGGDCDVEEDFSGGTTFDPINETGWTNVAVAGTEPWVYRDFDNDFFAHKQGYQSDDPNIESWLVTPAIDLSTAKVLNFESETAFWAHDGLSVWFSNDFNGNVENATWNQLSANLAGENNANYERVNSGNINLPVGGTGYVAFKYVGDNTTNTSTYRIDNIFVCKP